MFLVVEFSFPLVGFQSLQLLNVRRVKLETRNVKLSPCSFDSKRIQPRNGLSIGYFYGVYAGCARAFAQSRMQASELVARALRQDFHAAVVIVADPSGDSQHVRFTLYEPAETDTLHASANQEAASQSRVFGGTHDGEIKKF